MFQVGPGFRLVYEIKTLMRYIIWHIDVLIIVIVSTFIAFIVVQVVAELEGTGDNESDVQHMWVGEKPLNPTH